MWVDRGGYTNADIMPILREERRLSATSARTEWIRKVARMLRKIDCVMIRVEDPQAAALYYSDVLGLRRIWQDETSVGLGFPETDAEVVLHCNSEIPSRVDVYYLVDDVVCSVGVLRQNGCTVLAEPFEIAIGKCAVVRDPYGMTLSMLDMSKGPRQPLAD